MSRPSIIPRNEKLLDQYRGPGSCGYCGRWCQFRDASHAFEKGVNSWKRIDLPWNLIGLGTNLPIANACHCHAQYHAGRIPRGQILEKIAAREGVTVQWIIDTHTELLLRGGKGGRLEEE